MNNPQSQNNKSALVISSAVRLALTEVLLSLTQQGMLRMDDEGNYIHDHLDEEQGSTCVHQQKLIIDELTPEWFTVSFAGSREFLDAIESEGWESSVSSVHKYLIATGAQIDFDLGELNYFTLINTFSQAIYTVVINTNEDPVRVRDIADAVGLDAPNLPEEETQTMNQNTNTANNDSFDAAVNDARDSIQGARINKLADAVSEEDPEVESLMKRWDATFDAPSGGPLKDAAASIADTVADAADAVADKAERVADSIRADGDGAVTAERNKPWYKREGARYAVGEILKTGVGIAGVTFLGSLAIRALWKNYTPSDDVIVLDATV